MRRAASNIWFLLSLGNILAPKLVKSRGESNALAEPRHNLRFIVELANICMDPFNGAARWLGEDERAAECNLLMLVSLCRPSEAASARAEDLILIDGERVWRIRHEERSPKVPRLPCERAVGPLDGQLPSALGYKAGREGRPKGEKLEGFAPAPLSILAVVRELTDTEAAEITVEENRA